jgi:hypothetical protein
MHGFEQRKLNLDEIISEQIERQFFRTGMHIRVDASRVEAYTKTKRWRLVYENWQPKHWEKPVCILERTAE